MTRKATLIQLSQNCDKAHVYIDIINSTTCIILPLHAHDLVTHCAMCPSLT
jgi:hypothetical protein